MLDYKNSIFPYQEGHQMEYIDEYDEWRCPECGRIIKFSRDNFTVIIPGNQFATHIGSKGGLVMGNIRIT